MEWEVNFQSIIVEADTEEEATEEAQQQVIIGNLEEESVEPFMNFVK